MPVKRSKYGNKKVEINGIKFDSKKEGERYLVLKDMEKCGEISDLILQPRLPIIINDIKVCDYIADFQYTDNNTVVTEDCKGFKTAIYRLKKKLVKACLGIDIKET